LDLVEAHRMHVTVNQSRVRRHMSEQSLAEHVIQHLVCH
jgi:hypothetical protein